MGLFECPFVCHITEEPDYTSLENSLSSQPSLPTVPSLTRPLSSEIFTSQNHCIATLKGHTSYVFSLALTGQNLYSGSSDNEIHVWNLDKSTTTYKNHKLATCHSAVKSIVILHDKLFTAHNDHKIHVWRINNQNENLKHITTLPTINDQFRTLFSSKNYIKVRRHKVRTFVHHVDAISALSLSKDGSLLYSVSWDRTFKVWKTSNFTCLESYWNAHDDAINAIAVSNDGIVYTGSADKKIKVWIKRNKKHELVDTLEKHKSSVNALALNDDGSILYSGACDRSIVVWEKDSGGKMAVIGALRGHSRAILSIKTVGDLVCSGSADKTVRVWKRGIGNVYWCIAVLEGHREPVKCLTATVDISCGSSCGSQEGNVYLIYSGSLDCDIKVWRVCVQSH